MLYKERKKGEQSVTTTTTKKGNESYLCVEGVGGRGGDLLCSRVVGPPEVFTQQQSAYGDENDARILEAKCRGKNGPFSHKDTPLSLRTHI